MKILVHNDSFFEIASFSRSLLKEGHTVIFAPTEIETTTILQDFNIDALLCDASKLEWVKSLIVKMPEVNIALFSDMEERVFHRCTEGLGILMNLSHIPEKAEADFLLNRLEFISSQLPAHAYVEEST